MLILDEFNYAKELLKNKNFGKYVKLKDIVILAKYYSHEGKDTREIKKLLRTICKKVDRDWNEVTQGWKIKIAMREVHKRRIRTSVPVPITLAELEKIKEVNDYVMEKVLFVFLVYGKFLKYNNTLIKPRVRARLVGSFYVNERLSNIFSVAHIEIRKKLRNDMAHALYNMGYIDATRYDGFILKYAFEDSPTALVIEDYDNIVLYYQREKGEQIGGCSCGRLFLKKSKRDTQCNKCKREKRREQWKERQKKHRNELNMSRYSDSE